MADGTSTFRLYVLRQAQRRNEVADKVNRGTFKIEPDTDTTWLARYLVRLRDKQTVIERLEELKALISEASEKLFAERATGVILKVTQERCLQLSVEFCADLLQRVYAMEEFVFFAFRSFLKTQQVYLSGALTWYVKHEQDVLLQHYNELGGATAYRKSKAELAVVKRSFMHHCLNRRRDQRRKLVILRKKLASAQTPAQRTHANFTIYVIEKELGENFPNRFRDERAQIAELTLLVDQFNELEGRLKRLRSLLHR